MGRNNQVSYRTIELLSSPRAFKNMILELIVVKIQKIAKSGNTVLKPKTCILMFLGP